MTLSKNTQIISNTLSDIKNSLINKGITPSGDITTYANAIQDITGSKTQPLTIDPSDSIQEITTPSGVGGYNPITVNPVTSDIDSNIIPENIKKGVNILGVEGILSASDITPTGTVEITENGVYDVSSYATANVNVSGSTVYGHTIDTILGDVDDNGVLQNSTVQPTLTTLSFDDIADISSGWFMHSWQQNTSLSSVSFPELENLTGVDALNSAFKDCPNLTLVNFPNLTSIKGKGSINSCFYGCTSLTSAEFPKLTNIEYMKDCFYGCTSLTSVEFPNLQKIYEFEKVFYGCSNLKTVSFPELNTIGNTTSYAFKSTFYNCTSLNSIEFPKLSNIPKGYTFYYAFQNCTSLTNVYFPALNSNSFENNNSQFRSMLPSVTGCTVHFPSNLESVIGGWSDVTSGFGGTNTIVLFDLPATS